MAQIVTHRRKVERKVERMGGVAFLNDLREIKRLEKEPVSRGETGRPSDRRWPEWSLHKNMLYGLEGESDLVIIGINKANTDKLKPDGKWCSETGLG